MTSSPPKDNIYTFLADKGRKNLETSLKCMQKRNQPKKMKRATCTEWCLTRHASPSTSATQTETKKKAHIRISLAIYSSPLQHEPFTSKACLAWASRVRPPESETHMLLIPP